MTPTQLETELREALSARADELPPDAGARLRRIDYHARSRRIRPQLALGAVIGTAGGAGAIAAAVALTTATSNAFAGWTPKPTTASRAQIAGAEAACRTRLPCPLILLRRQAAADRLRSTRCGFRLSWSTLAVRSRSRSSRTPTTAHRASRDQGSSRCCNPKRAAHPRCRPIS